MKKLTVKQQRFLETVMKLTKKKGYPPTITELCEIFKVSIGTVQQYFFALEKKGIIKRENNKGRGLRFLIDIPEDDGNFLTVPILDYRLKNSENYFSVENIVGHFKFPADLFREKKLYSVHFKDSFVVFNTGAGNAEGTHKIIYKKNKLHLISSEKMKNTTYSEVGNVLYLMKKDV